MQESTFAPDMAADRLDTDVLPVPDLPGTVVPEASMRPEMISEPEFQWRMLSDYHREAIEDLGTEKEPYAIWNKVLDKQLIDMDLAETSVQERAIATNVLIGNAFVADGYEQPFADSIIQNRMWAIAVNGKGERVLQAAEAYDGQEYPELPESFNKVSVMAQADKYRQLLEATDRTVDLATSDKVVDVIAEATPAQQRWYIGSLVISNNFETARKNVELVGDKRRFCEEIVSASFFNEQVYDALGLEAAISPREVVESALDQGLDADYIMPYSRLSAEDQSAIFKRLFTEDRGRITDHFVWKPVFTKLGAAELDTLIDGGYLQGRGGTPLKSFTDLPKGYIEKVEKAGFRTPEICASLKSFDPEDRVAYYEKLMADKNMFAASMVFANPDQFDFIDRDTLIEEARKHNDLHAIARSIAKYTDGSDQKLLDELIENGHGSSLADSRKQMPAVDTEYLLDRFAAEHDYLAMLKCGDAIDTSGQKQLLADILQSDDGINSLNWYLDHLDKLDPAEVLASLTRSHAYQAIVSNLGYFKDETPDSILEKIRGHPDGRKAIAEHTHHFETVDIWGLAQELVSDKDFQSLSNIGGELLKAGIDANWLYSQIAEDPECLLDFIRQYNAPPELKKFMDEIGEAKIAHDIVSRVPLDKLAYRMSAIEDPAARQMYFDRCIAEKNAGAVQAVLYDASIDNFDHRALVRQLCEIGWERPLIKISSSDFMTSRMDPDTVPTADELIGWGGAAVVLTRPDLYPDVDKDALTKRLLASDDLEMITEIVYTSTDKLPIGYAEKLIGSEYMFVVANRKKLFNPEDMSAAFIERCITEDVSQFAELYRYSNQHIDWVDRGLKTFGVDAAPQLVLSVREIATESGRPLSAELQQLGVTSHGHLGLEQLRTKVQDIRRTLIHTADSTSQAELASLTLENNIARSITKQLTRFGESEWGNHSEDAWETMMRKHMAVADKVKPLSPEFKPSKLYEVPTLDAKEFDPSKLDEDAVNRYSVLRESLDLGVQTAESPPRGRYEPLFGAARDLLAAEITRKQTLRAELVAKGQEKGVANIDKQITALQQVSDMSTKEFVRTTRQDFKKIASLNVKGMEHILRAGAYARAMKLSPQARQIGRMLRGQPATYDNMVAMNNFVEHIVNQEVYDQFFANTEAYKSFKRMSDTTALRHQMTKLQNAKTTGMTTLQFVPSRGILLELSGHIGDACWASMYDSVAEEFPNITSLTYVRNPGKQTERIVGAGLIVETKDEDTGEDIVVLRGTNPIENYINGVKVESFHNSLVNYVTQVAGKRRVAVVIDGYSGGAATNRPVVHEYLTDQLKRDITSARSVNMPKDTTFNGYVLSKRGNHPAFYIT